MSSDKRRRARVQGGWAAPAAPRGRGWASGASAAKPPMNGPTALGNSTTRPPTTSDEVSRNPGTRPSVIGPSLPGSQGGPSPGVNTVGAACLGKTVDVPNNRKFVYQEPEEEIKQKPPVRVIEKVGIYDLSTSPNGEVARIRLFPNFIEPSECQWIYEQLYQELPWQQRSDVKKGVSYMQPRLTAWYGDHGYQYSGVQHEANRNWSPMLTMLKDRLEEVTGYKFNSMLANLYRDGHDSVAWHSDDEPSLRRNPTIASLSFGDTRNFEMRKKPAKGEPLDFTYMEHIRIPLTAGSLLIMEGSTQEEWQHQIPREYHDRDARINLTFRVIYPE